MTQNRPPQTGRAADRADFRKARPAPNSAPAANPQAAASLDGDHVTLLRVQPGHRAVKTITRDGVLPYDAGVAFGHEEVAVNSLATLAAVLRRLEDDPLRFVIRAALKPEFRSQPFVFRRKLGDTARLDPVPRRWCAFDFDHVEIDDPTDVWSTARAGVAMLPEPFQRAAYHAQLTASAGLTPEGRIRLWFWLSRPTTGRELKDWLRGVQVDTSTCEDVTPIYTAAPILAPGVADPLGGKRRSVTAWMDGAFADLAELVEVPDEIPPAQRGAAWTRNGGRSLVAGPAVTIPRIRRRTEASRYAEAQLGILRRAGRGEGRASLTRCAMKIAALDRRRLLVAAPWFERIRLIMRGRGWSPDETTRGDTLCDVNRQIDWAREMAGVVEVRRCRRR